MNRNRQKFSRETLRFETDLEKKIHKIISKARVGTTLEIEFLDNKEEVMNSIKKSLFYNNIDCIVRVHPNNNTIILKFEY